eukprot:9494240-Pyramimonas_sp.AAC.1
MQAKIPAALIAHPTAEDDADAKKPRALEKAMSARDHWMSEVAQEVLDCGFATCEAALLLH